MESAVRFFQWHYDHCQEIAPVDFTTQRGVFRTLFRGKDEIENLEAHLARLDQELLSIGLKPHPFSSRRLIENTEGFEGRLKLIVTQHGGFHTLSLHQRDEKKMWKVAFMERKTPFVPYKSLDYSHRHQLKEEAKLIGVDEVIEVDKRGNVLEATYSNVVWKEGDLWFTPNPKVLPVYFGVTLQEWGKSRCLNFTQKNQDGVKKLPLFLCSALKGVVSAHLL